jgi:cell migration-inducing and hyaluronan-binding protein
LFTSFGVSSNNAVEHAKFVNAKPVYFPPMERKWGSDNFTSTAYKNRNGGIWGRGEMHEFKNIKFADNAFDFTHASGAFGRYTYTSRVVDSLFVGETENVGNPKTDAEKAYGRSFPKPDMPDYPIHGYEYYDYRHDVVNSTFVNFQDNATRKAGAISVLFYASFGVSSNNAVDHVKFVNSKPVYFPPMERKWGNDNGASTAYKTAAIRDHDGSFGGGPESYVLINDGVNDSIAVDQGGCEIKPTWNAAVCKGDVGRMNIGGGGGGRGALGGPGGPGAAKGGPGGLGAAKGGPGGPVAAGGPGGPGAAKGGPGGPGAAKGGPGGPGAAKGGFGGGAAAPAQPPIILSRNGKDYTVTNGTVRAGTEIKVTTERPSVALSVNEMEKGSWVIFQLPGFTTAATGDAQASLDALRKSTTTSYFKDKDALWVKVVSPGDPNSGAPGGGASVTVTKAAATVAAR